MKANRHPLGASHPALLGVMGLFLVWTAFPLLWVLYSSLKTDTAILEQPFAPPGIDRQPEWSNYDETWHDEGFSTYFANSVVVVGTSVFFILVLSAPAAYALSRFAHPLGPPLLWLFLAGMMIPIQLSVVPLFFQLRDWNLLHSRTGLILVYTASGLPFGVFILSGFFRTLPRSLYEAAILDGCGNGTAFWRVMLPLARPGLITVAIMQFIILWKEFFFAFMFLSGDRADTVSTLALGLAGLAVTSQYRTDYGILFAGLAIVTLPLLAVYILLQKHLVKGVASGAVKG